MISLKITEIYGKQEAKCRIGFRNGKVVALTHRTEPWREIEITPDKLDFVSIRDEIAKHDYLRVRATLNLTPELESVLQELFTAKLISMDTLFDAKENGYTTYGVVLPDTTEKEFMTVEFKNGIVINGVA